MGLTARLLSIANQANDQDREFLYSTIFALDTSEAKLNHTKDERTFFQDRYWPSVIAYGNFLNKEKTIHSHIDYKPLFLLPDATILFSCSYAEKVRRSEKRGRKSVLDSFLLSNPNEVRRLELEIEKSLEGLPNIHRIDTTDMTIEEVGSEIMDYSRKVGLI
jgi:thymidylate kinase